MNETVGRLLIDDFAVSLTRVTEHYAQDVGSSSPAVLIDDRSPFAEVNLCLFASGHFHPAKWQRVGLF